MGLIIFIHGMGHNPNRKYWKGWGDNLQPYLVEQGINPKTINFGGIYYYDLVPGPGDGWKKITSIFRQGVIEQIKIDIYQHIIRGGDMKSMLGRGPVEGFVNLVADNFGDIFTYLLDNTVYEQVNNRFYTVLEQATEPITLVAYSLGSMVSFCALQQKPDLANKIHHFITVGSPIFWFRKWLYERANLSQRPTAAPWTNLAGKLDVACPHMVGYSCKPDQVVEFQLEKYNPIKGHLAYFSEPEGLKNLARAVATQWQ